MIDDVQKGEAQLLDVRSEDEWDAGHAAGALHIPIHTLIEGAVKPLDPAKKVYIYCAAGGRAGRAATYLREHGFTAENVGGLSDWVAAGGAVE